MSRDTKTGALQRKLNHASPQISLAPSTPSPGVAALFYLVVTLPLARLVSMLEAHLTGRSSGSACVSKKPLKSAGTVVATPPDHIAGL